MKLCRHKIRYRDKLGAMIAVASTQAAAARGVKGRDETRVYRCPHCHGWHTTSQPKRRAA